MSVTAKDADPFACAFWLQRFSLIALVKRNDSLITFLCVPLSICASGSTRLGSQFSAFIPASRIEDQSLPWGMCFNPSPGW
jgi:hypothetical protein